MADITNLEIDKYNRKRAKLELDRIIPAHSELWRVTFRYNGQKAMTEIIFTEELLSDAAFPIDGYVRDLCQKWVEKNG